MRALPAPGVFAARRERAGVTEHRFDKPLASLLVRGVKTTEIAGKRFDMGPGQILTAAADLPSVSFIREASPKEPLLTIFFYLKPELIGELLLETDFRESPPNYVMKAACVNDADDDFLEAIARFTTPRERNARTAWLEKTTLKELHYLLLSGAQGALLRSLYATRGPCESFLLATNYLKERLDKRVGAEELAKAAHVSESALYRQFKAVTGLSPLQYHKRLRLYEARRIILAENERAANAAYRVGYESVPQFTREYKKLFGTPPKRRLKEEK